MWALRPRIHTRRPGKNRLQIDKYNVSGRLITDKSFYLPGLVTIISFPTSLNCVQSSLSSKFTVIPLVSIERVGGAEVGALPFSLPSGDLTGSDWADDTAFATTGEV